MIVYGDRERTLSLAAAVAGLRDPFSMARRAPPDRRREACTRLLIETGCCSQALLDREHARHGTDEDGPLQQDCLSMCRSSARGLLLALGTRPMDAAWHDTFLHVLDRLQQLAGDA